MNNPNPRAWRCGEYVIIDLDSVLVVYINPNDGMTEVLVGRGRGEPTSIMMVLSGEQIRSLFDAIEIYRSAR